MKGFKATKNMKCLTLTYEEGKTYSINNLVICSHGFHFCKKMKDVLRYYKYDDEFVLMEVEALGKTITDYDKTVTDCLKIIRVIPKEEYTFEIPEPMVDHNIYEYDDRNNMISVTFPSGYKTSWKYDDLGNKISETDSDGFVETSYEYDDRGNMISETDSDGYKISYEYDDRNNMISVTFLSGYKYSCEYDDRNNMISETFPNGNKTSYEYDDRNNMISSTHPDGSKWSWEYDDRNNRISETCNNQELYRITIN